MKPPWWFYDADASYRRAKANEAKRQRGADAVVEHALAQVRARMDGDASFPVGTLADRSTLKLTPTTQSASGCGTKLNLAAPPWVGKLPFGEGVQRGLYLVARRPEALSAVSRFLTRAVDRAGIHPVVLAGNARPSASHASAAIEASVLIVDRVEFASDEVTAILSHRAETQRPVVVTSCVDREDLPDGVLLRTLRPATELVRLDPVAHPRAKHVPSAA